MNYRDAVDGLCKGLGHERLARALGVSLQLVRQARLRPDAHSYRRPPKDWQNTVIRLAEERVEHYRKLIEKIRDKRGRDGG